MVNIDHRVGIKAPASKVFAALATVEGVGSWWTTSTTGSSTPGGNVDVRFLKPDGEERGRMTFEVAELDADRKVRWRFHDGPAEWIGTDVTFELRQEGEYTIVLFGHHNWREFVEFTAHCSTKWATFLLSLKELVETGQGRPSPHDVKIDDWN